MNCAVKNKSISRKKSAEYGKKEAAKRISLYLDYALSDKCGYSPKMISNIHSTLDRYIDDVYEGRISPAELQRELCEDYGAIIELGKNRQKPPGDVNFIDGVYYFMDRFNIILLYVLIVKYKMGKEKVNKIMRYIQNAVECFNQGYIEESELEEILVSENNVTPRLVGGERFAK